MTTTQAAVKDYYNSEKADDWYTKLWGEGNIHFGFWPKLTSLPQGDESWTNPLPIESLTPYDKASELMTQRMVKLGEIDASSRVLDFGCGYGKPICDVAQQTGATAVGLDLSEVHIKRAQGIKSKHYETQNVSFVQGSFTNVPENVKSPFTHVWTQAALCHVHPILDKVLSEANRMLAPGGKLVLNDCTSNLTADDRTKVNVYERMNFEFLIPHAEYLKKIEAAGFKIVYEEELNGHFWQSYHMLAHKARANEMPELATKYEETCASITRNQYGINIIIAEKTGVKSSHGTESPRSTGPPEQKSQTAD